MYSQLKVVVGKVKDKNIHKQLKLSLAFAGGRLEGIKGADISVLGRKAVDVAAFLLGRL